MRIQAVSQSQAVQSAAQPLAAAKPAETRAFFDAYTDVSPTGPRPGKPNID